MSASFPQPGLGEVMEVAELSHEDFPAEAELGYSAASMH